MKTDNIRIKKKDSQFLIAGFIYLAIVLLGIFLISVPFLSFAPQGANMKAGLTALGAICLITGIALYGVLMFRGIRPQDALVITNKGFTNHLVGGKEGVYIEWIQVTSIRIFGMSKSPMLGLTLENNDAYLASLEGKDKHAAQDNVELGLPIVVIPQKDIVVPLAELKALCSRMVKGAISWEQYEQNKRNASQATAEAAATREKPQANVEFSANAGANAPVESLFTKVTPPQQPAAETVQEKKAEVKPAAPTEQKAESAAPAEETPVAPATTKKPAADTKTATHSYEPVFVNDPPLFTKEHTAPADNSNQTDEIILLDIDND